MQASRYKLQAASFSRLAYIPFIPEKKAGFSISLRYL